jgi:hypothetical protein
MVNLIIEDVTCTALAYAYGKFIAVICPTQILASLMFHLQLFDRSVCMMNWLYLSAQVVRSLCCQFYIIFICNIVT